MRASKFSDAQKSFILNHDADGIWVLEMSCRAGISPAAYFNWKKKYDGVDPTETRRLNQLECANSKLKKVVADMAQEKLADWRRYYNQERPHGAIGQKASMTQFNLAEATDQAACIAFENCSEAWSSV
jgi:putative transposase